MSGAGTTDPELPAPQEPPPAEEGGAIGVIGARPTSPSSEPSSPSLEPSSAAPVPPAPPSRWPKGVSSLAHWNFRVFWTGQLVSLVGTWMQSVAQGWLVFQLTNDPVALGIVAACQFVPVLIFGLFAGVFADTLPKRTALLGTQAAAGVLALILGLLEATGTVQVWHVYGLAIALGFVNALDMPVRQAFVVEMVGRKDVANAVALSSAAFNGARIVGPAIAGLVIGSIGIAACFFVNAASYVAVIVGLLMMHTDELVCPGRTAMQRSVRGVADQLVEGLRYVRTTPNVFISIVVLGVVATVALNFSVTIPVLAKDVLGGGADTYGFLMAASGIGSLASALAIAFGQRPTMRLLLIGAGAIGASLILLGVSRWLPLSLLLMLVLGWGVIAMAATTNTLIQLSVPDALRGRVMSVYTTVFAGSTPFGGIFAGTLAALAGVGVALIAGGALALLTALVVAWRLPGLGAGPRGTVPRLATER
jgi:MFS family permease